MTALAVVVGPVLGGAITQGIAWQWIFWLNVPVGLLTIPLAMRHLDESYGPCAALDLPGVALGTGAALGLVWGLVRGSSAGWASPEAAGTLAAGAAAAVAFTCWELRARAPMLPMRLFAIRGFSAGNAMVFLMNASITGAVFFMAQFQQVGLGQDPLGAGLRLRVRHGWRLHLGRHVQRRVRARHRGRGRPGPGRGPRRAGPAGPARPGTGRADRAGGNEQHA